MDVKEIAQKVLERLGPNGENWTQGEFARDKDGQRVARYSKEAVCWCLIGAIPKQVQFPDYSHFVDELVKKMNGQLIPNFNDTHTFPEVKAVLEELAK